MEGAARFRAGEDPRVVEVRIKLVRRRLGVGEQVAPTSGGTIHPGELFVVGDRITPIGEEVPADLQLVVETTDPVSQVTVDADSLLSALNRAEPSQVESYKIAGPEWGIELEL